MKYNKKTLKNGLRILTIPMQGTQTATVMIMVGVGSRFEDEKHAGLSHFIEHMLFKGTERRPAAQSISEELDAVGGEFNAFTAKDKTAYYAKVDSKHTEKALDVLADMFLFSKFDEKEIEREKGPILQELSMYEDEPRRGVGEEFEKLLYNGNPMGREIIGTKESIRSFKRKDFIEFMKKNYPANETIFCVAGKFNEKEIVSHIERIAKHIKAGKRNSFKKVSENQKKPGFIIKHKKTDQTHIILGARAYHQNHKDRYALGLLAVILGGNMSSRLFLKIRERQGLAYFVHTGVDTYQDCGYIATQAGIEHKNLSRVVASIMQEYEKIRQEEIDGKELQKAKDFIKGRSIMGLESSDDVAMFFVDQEMHKEKILIPKEVFARIDAVTTHDIARVAKDVFRNERINLAIIGPHVGSKEIEKIIHF